MRYPRLVLFAALFAGGLHSADWVAIKTDHFHLYSSDGSKDARTVLSRFEQIRDLFVRTGSVDPQDRRPVTLVHFRNQKEYRPYSPSEAADAYYIRDTLGEFIVLSGMDEQQFPLVVHEYMHLLIERMNLRLPVWLNEGIAEVYSTLRPMGGKILLGDIPVGRAQELSRSKWLATEQLLAVSPSSPEYNEKNRAGTFYAQSWMLTHMLMLHAEYRTEFSKFLTTVSGGAPSEAAFRSVYGKTTADVGRDLKNYYGSNSLNGSLIDAKFQRAQAAEATEADPLEVDYVLARLQMLTGRSDEAQSRLEALAGRSPGKWELHDALAYLALRRKDTQTARSHMKKAVALQPPVERIYWDYARLAAGDESERGAVIDALRNALRLNGNNLDAKLMLGWQLFSDGQHKAAYDAFRTIRNVDPARATRLFLGLAYSAARLEDWPEAEKAAALAAKHAREPADVDAAQKFQSWLKQRSAGVGPPTASVAVLTQVTGALQRVECFEGKARLYLNAAGRALVLLIREASDVVNSTDPGKPLDLSCGDAGNKQVTVGYVPAKDAATQTDGEVRAIGTR